MSPWQAKFCPDLDDDRFWDPRKDWWSNTYENGKPEGSGGPTNPGSGISWQPGTPATQCTSLGSPAVLKRDLGPFSFTGAGRCGTSCDKNWYCNWWENGLPLWYFDPLDPVSFFPSYFYI